MEELGRLPLLSRERDFSRSSISWLQLVLYVQASEFACLPGRSYRCKFPCRAAEAFTSELNVHRYLCTHRICYPPDYRQLASEDSHLARFTALSTAPPPGLLCPGVAVVHPA